MTEQNSWAIIEDFADTLNDDIADYKRRLAKALKKHVEKPRAPLPPEHALSNKWYGGLAAKDDHSPQSMGGGKTYEEAAELLFNAYD